MLINKSLLVLFLMIILISMFLEVVRYPVKASETGNATRPLLMVILTVNLTTIRKSNLKKIPDIPRP